MRIAPFLLQVFACSFSGTRRPFLVILTFMLALHSGKETCEIDGDV
jgi:hypothetical protein